MIRNSSIANFLESTMYIFIIVSGVAVQAQDGTYELKNKNGSYGLISLITNQDHITAEIFTWWNTPSAQTGSYYGHGVLSSNRVVLKSTENDPECIVKMTLMNPTIAATFEKCMTDHLTEDFNGTYRKISEATAGDYVVKADRTFFHSKPDEYSKQKSYLIKGNTVTFNLDGGAVGNWVFVHYRHKNSTGASGYIKLTDLEKR